MKAIKNGNTAVNNNINDVHISKDLTKRITELKKEIEKDVENKLKTCTKQINQSLITFLAAEMSSNGEEMAIKLKEFSFRAQYYGEDLPNHFGHSIYKPK